MTKRLGIRKNYWLKNLFLIIIHASLKPLEIGNPNCKNCSNLYGLLFSQFQHGNFLFLPRYSKFLARGLNATQILIFQIYICFVNSARQKKGMSLKSLSGFNFFCKFTLENLIYKWKWYFAFRLFYKLYQILTEEKKQKWTNGQ